MCIMLGCRSNMSPRSRYVPLTKIRGDPRGNGSVNRDFPWAISLPCIDSFCLRSPAV